LDVLLLGPVKLDGQDEAVGIARRQERLLLAALAVRAPHYVSLPRLVELIWAGNEPARPVAAVQSMVAHLRRLVRRAVPDREVIASCGQGYAWRGHLDEIDLHRALRAVAAAGAAGPGLERLRLLGEALSEWRGPAVIDVGDELARRRVLAAHADLWLSTYQEWLAAHIDTGRHTEVVGPLSMLAGQRPLSEAVQVLLMLALHQAGRRDEALEVYLRTRRLLVAELGVEPGQGLREAHRLVLRGTPGPPWTTGPRVPGCGPRGWAGSLLPGTMVSSPGWGGSGAHHLVHS
jgi:SARP family transcriptional regulator, regulator of embCAB operon